MSLVVQRPELCFLVLGFLKDGKFKASYEAFQKECEPIVKSLKRVSVCISPHEPIMYFIFYYLYSIN